MVSKTINARYYPKIKSFSKFLRCYNVVEDLSRDPDIVFFLEGPNISPILYDQVEAPQYGPYNSFRDLEDFHRFWEYFDIPKVGIARGAHFLNAMNGGCTLSYINGHTYPTHPAKDNLTNETVLITSGHSNGLVPRSFINPDNLITETILLESTVSSKKTIYLPDQKTYKTVDLEDLDMEQLIHTPLIEVESVAYEETKCLCFQPRPYSFEHNTGTSSLLLNYLKVCFQYDLRKKEFPNDAIPFGR